MRTSFSVWGLVLAFGALVLTAIPAAEVVIESTCSNGTLRWNHPTNGIVRYRIEWAPHPASSNWYALGCELAPTNETMAVAVPRFFRVAIHPVPANMVLIPGGTVTGMDPDFGEYSLTVEPFWMDRYEVTKALWSAVHTWAVANGYGFSYNGSGKATNHPVHTVNWYDCVKWCNARSQKEGRTPVYYTDAECTQAYKGGQVVEPCVKAAADGYRLPTEVQWEVAARGGLSGCRFPWGDTIQHAQANYRSNQYDYPYDVSPTYGYHPAYDDGTQPYTSPAGSFAPNGYGLHDMAGNVEEWCYDWYPGLEGVGRVLCGGHWATYADRCRVGHCWGEYIDYGGNRIGFRTVLASARP